MTKKLKLISEQNDTDVKFLTEDKKDGSKNYYIEGIYAQSEKVNQNNRIYPKSVMEKAVAHYNEKYVSKKRALGELNHPDSPTINLERVSHIITELKMNGTDVYGKAKLLDTPYGKIAKNFIDEGITLGVSTRALGSLTERHDGVSEVSDDFELSTVDIVADPSAPEAFVNGIMENKEWVYENGIVKAVEVESYKRKIIKTNRKNLDQLSVQLFETFLRKLKHPLLKESGSHEIDEIVLYIENDGQLYRSMRSPMIKNIAGHIKRGKLDRNLAMRHGERLAKEGIQKYEKEFRTKMQLSRPDIKKIIEILTDGMIRSAKEI